MAVTKPPAMTTHVGPMTAEQAATFRAAVAEADRASPPAAVVIESPGYSPALDLDLLARLDGLEAAANDRDDYPGLVALVTLRAAAIARLHAAG